MAVHIKFDSNQPYQRDAIESVVQLLAGQECAAQGFVSADMAEQGFFEEFQELVFGNSLSLSPETLERNLRRVQERPILRADGSSVPAIPHEFRAEFDPVDPELDFSVEMETGTGKTYVYLRTAIELHKKFGFTKFLIVVPSIAIREGVLSSLQLLKEHLRDLYDGLQYDAYVWNSRFPSRARQFATASHLQLMVINIDSFASENTVFRKADPDRLNGYSPAAWVSACHPIVIMDEPQNMETPIRREAIRSLSPLFRLRYSATHRDLKHLVYRLTPVDAYNLRLVKRIGVLSITRDIDSNDAFIEVAKIRATPKTVTATARIHKRGKDGTKATRVTLRKDDDLFDISGGRSVYQGWAVEDIVAAKGSTPGVVQFSNGRSVFEGVTPHSEDDQHQRLTIRMAIESHFEKELRLKFDLRRGVIGHPIKPLTLIFIDRVANYHPPQSKFRVWFEQEYLSVQSDARFRSLVMPDVSLVHDGYFATSTKGVPKDTAFGRDTKDAETAFQRIMRDKEGLISPDNPLRFIFSHSALVEGWDNPNVFTICNLQDGKSELRKRQQVGRGLRLPIMANGDRCRVDDVNWLTVIANEGFTKFASDLQREIEEETGVKFQSRVADLQRDRIRIHLKEEMLVDPIFIELWDRISRRTSYSLAFEADAVVAEAVSRINVLEPLEPIKFRARRQEAEITHEGIVGTETRDRGSVEVAGARRIPDIVGELCQRVPISRASVLRILRAIDNLDQARINPSLFIDNVEAAMNQALYVQAVKGIVYSPRGEERWDKSLFKANHQEETIVDPEFVVEVTKSVTDQLVCDSKIEVAFARYLEGRDDVPLFLKLPYWFKIATPLGNYNPDWAFVRTGPRGRTTCFVRETKGTDRIDRLQWEAEGWKIQFGTAHFKALGVDYAFHHDPARLIEPTVWG